MTTGNKPYVKEYNDDGVVVNEITIENPYMTGFPANRSQMRGFGKYMTSNGQRFRKNGNNRANTCTRGHQSRHTLN